MAVTKLILEAIFAEFCPHVDPDLDGPGTKHVKRGPGTVPDPRVLYVGPFLTGLVQAFPEMFPDRRRAKGFFHDIGHASIKTAWNIRSQAFMQRDTWPKTKKGNTPRLFFSPNIVNEEYGELRNSLHAIRDAATGTTSLREPRPQLVNIGGDEVIRNVYEPAKPKILEDHRYGLHYLMVGDEFHFEWIDVHEKHYTRNFTLLQMGGGNEVIADETTDDQFLD